MTVAAVVLGGGGVGAFFLADGAHRDGVTACAQKGSTAPDACDSERTAVRAWDYVAGAAWLGATASAIVATALWIRPADDGGRSSARLVLGPFALGLAGRF
jgi:hypothetical protein